MESAPKDFEEFWKHFLLDHPSEANRWMHVGALVAGIYGVAAARRRLSLKPLVVGGALAAALAFGGHPLFQGDRPKNFNRPMWAARGFLRLCVRTVNGRAKRELRELQEERERATSN